MDKRDSVWVQASEWLSRSLAIVTLMILPGFGGGALDKWLGTTLFMPIGFILGVILGTMGLIIVAKQMNDPLRRNSPGGKDEEKDRSS